jgi:L-lactate utilization protein LutB
MSPDPARAGALGDGQDMSVYTTFSTGPRAAGDPDGPEEYHVVLLDNGRSDARRRSFRTCCAASAAAPA